MPGGEGGRALGPWEGGGGGEEGMDGGGVLVALEGGRQGRRVIALGEDEWCRGRTNW